MQSMTDERNHDKVPCLINQSLLEDGRGMVHLYHSMNRYLLIKVMLALNKAEVLTSKMFGTHSLLTSFF